MSRQHAKRQSPRRNAGYQSSVPGWVWLFTGCVIGAFVMFLVYLRDVPPQPSVLSESTKSSDDTTADTEKPGMPEPRFVFYELLKETEVTINPEPVDSQRLPVPPADNVEYILQAGSFRNAADADRLRAQLILANLESRVDKTEIGGQTWHRVMVGPFKTRAMAAKARGTLATMDLDSIMRERRTDG